MENLVDIRCRMCILSELPEDDAKLRVDFARSELLKTSLNAILRNTLRGCLKRHRLFDSAFNDPP